MKSLVKVNVLIVIMMTVSTVFISCQKNQLTNVRPEEIAQNEGSVVAKISYPGTYPVYEVDPAIMAYFQHYYQLDAPTIGSNACGPASYMMAAACIANYRNPISNTYFATTSKLQSIYSIVKGWANANNSGYITLEHLRQYAITYDNSFIVNGYKYTNDREETKTFIKSALANDRFVIVGVNAYIMSPSPVDNSNFFSNTSINGDLNPTGNVTSGTYRNYISTLDEGGNVGGHMIIVVKFVQTASDGNGYIEYIDPIAKTRIGLSNRRFVSFTRLLDAMKMNGNNSNYDAISIGNKP